MYEHLYERDCVVARHRWMALCAGLNDEPYIVSSPGVLVVPLDADGNVILINEPARTDGQRVLFLPSGALEGKEPADAANQELREEIGYEAARLDRLGLLHPLARHAIWENTVMLARDLSPNRQEGDEGYEIEVVRVPFDDFETLIASGRLTDAGVIAALYLARSFVQREAAGST